MNVNRPLALCHDFMYASVEVDWLEGVSFDNKWVTTWASRVFLSSVTSVTGACVATNDFVRGSRVISCRNATSRDNHGRWPDQPEREAPCGFRSHTE